MQHVLVQYYLEGSIWQQSPREIKSQKQKTIYTYVKGALEVVLSTSLTYPNSYLLSSLTPNLKQFWEGIALGAEGLYAPNVHV